MGIENREKLAMSGQIEIMTTVAIIPVINLKISNPGENTAAEKGGKAVKLA